MFLPMLLGLLLAGCQEQLTPQAEGALRAGADAYYHNDDANTVAQMSLFLDAHPKSPRACEAYYYRGRARYRLGDVPACRSDMEQALALTKDASLRASAAIVEADADFDSGNLVLAEQMYRLALNNLDAAAKPADHVLFRLGEALQRQGKWAAADLQFDRLRYLFPNSDVARVAGQMVRAKAWTIRAGTFIAKAPAELAAASVPSPGAPLTVEPMTLDGKLLFVLQGGAFATYEQAAAALPKVKEQFHTAAVMVRR